MPRPVRRPTPITLPHCPMDTLWEVDETLEQPQMRSVFEDDDISFPLPPRSLPPIRRFFSKMTTRSPPKPTRAPPPAPRPVSPAILVTRPVSPSSSASSSDTEPPRTPPAASAPLPAYILAPPPPAEWESAIDELFEMDDQEEEIKWSPSPQPIRSTDSYLSFSPPCSPRMTYMHPAKSPLPACMSVYASDSLPMSPTFNRPLASPGLLPTSPTSPALPRWPTVPFRSAVPLRPARSSRRMGIIPVRIES